MNKDNIASALGLGLAAVQASQIDYAKLAAGDRAEIAKLVFAFLFGALGIVTNKASK